MATGEPIDVRDVGRDDSLLDSLGQRRHLGVTDDPAARLLAALAADVDEETVARRLRAGRLSSLPLPGDRGHPRLLAAAVQRHGLRHAFCPGRGGRRRSALDQRGSSRHDRRCTCPTEGRGLERDRRRLAAGRRSGCRVRCRGAGPRRSRGGAIPRRHNARSQNACSGEATPAYGAHRREGRPNQPPQPDRATHKPARRGRSNIHRRGFGHPDPVRRGGASGCGRTHHRTHRAGHLALTVSITLTLVFTLA